MALKWERLAIAEPKHEFSHGTMYRTPVPGGWLVAVFWLTGNVGGPSMGFYPDPDHEWDGNSLDLGHTAAHAKAG